MINTRLLPYLMKMIVIGIMTVLVLLQTNVHLAEKINVEVVDINQSPLSDLVVYLLPLDQQKLRDTQGKSIVISQSKKMFTPYISVTRKDQGVTFSNTDNITHQIYSVSSKNRFSFRLQKGTKHTVAPLVNAGKILMGCNIHDWMSGYIMVVDTPFFSKTNDLGQTQFDVPQGGRYQLVVWHPQLMEQDQQLSRVIRISSDQHYRLKLSLPMAKIPDQANADGFDFLDNY